MNKRQRKKYLDRRNRAHLRMTRMFQKSYRRVWIKRRSTWWQLAKSGREDALDELTRLSDEMGLYDWVIANEVKNEGT